ncbi:carbohydrate sulfotransferase 12 [Lethenteron reissneri]|uniref:carbohydrate sulfotransferase 12 n=1 Tax=Lethenteron reissneri TaxID=7753 RepID=UPI002AB603F5|nr:carbohydrate sulfotransferase 12 [Lethenteron reissneri]
MVAAAAAAAAEETRSDPEPRPRFKRRTVTTEGGVGTTTAAADRATGGRATWPAWSHPPSPSSSSSSTGTRLAPCSCLSAPASWATTHRCHRLRQTIPATGGSRRDGTLPTSSVCSASSGCPRARPSDACRSSRRRRPPRRRRWRRRRNSGGRPRPRLLSQANIEEWERGYEKEATAEPEAVDDDRLAREQARRRARVRHACDSPDLIFQGKNRTFDEIPNRELKHLIVDDRHGTVYCYVPKVACTNWKRIMIVLSGSASNNGTPYADPMDIPPDVVHLSSSHQVFNQFWRKYGKSGRSRMKGKLQRYKKFLFVRDPFVRIISAFRSKFEIPNQDFYKAFVVPMLRQYQNVSAPPATAEEALSGGQRLKFSSFVQYLLDPATEREAPFNEHWRQVYRLCHPCQVPYDFVGRLETQSEDAPYLLRLLHAQDELRFPPGFLNRTDDRWEDRWFAGIPLDWRQRLYKLYEPDFVLFGYPYPRQLLHG